MMRKEAEKQMRELNETEPKWFCPMINAMCRKDCINFVLAYVDSPKISPMGIHDVKNDSFDVEGFQCSNAMFIGTSVNICDDEIEIEKQEKI